MSLFMCLHRCWSLHMAFSPMAATSILAPSRRSSMIISARFASLLLSFCLPSIALDIYENNSELFSFELLWILQQKKKWEKILLEYNILLAYISSPLYNLWIGGNRSARCTCWWRQGGHAHCVWQGHEGVHWGSLPQWLLVGVYAYIYIWIYLGFIYHACLLSACVNAHACRLSQAFTLRSLLLFRCMQWAMRLSSALRTTSSSQTTSGTAAGARSGELWRRGGIRRTW